MATTKTKNYTYKKEMYNNEPIMMIEPIDGQPDFTPDQMETAITEIEIHEGIKAETFRIVVKGDNRKWDGWDAKISMFNHLQGDNPYHAVNRWKKQLSTASEHQTVSDVQGRKPMYKK